MDAEDEKAIKEEIKHEEQNGEIFAIKVDYLGVFTLPGPCTWLDLMKKIELKTGIPPEMQILHVDGIQINPEENIYTYGIISIYFDIIGVTKAKFTFKMPDGEVKEIIAQRASKVLELKKLFSAKFEISDQMFLNENGIEFFDNEILFRNGSINQVSIKLASAYKKVKILCNNKIQRE